MYLTQRGHQLQIYPGEQIAINLRAYDVAMNPVYAEAFVSFETNTGAQKKENMWRDCLLVYVTRLVAVYENIVTPVFQILKLYTSSRAKFNINIKMTPCPLGFA